MSVKSEQPREVLVEFLRTVSDNGGAPFVRAGFIEVYLSRGPDDDGRFTVLVDGYEEQWPIERIRAAGSAGTDLVQR